MNPSIIIMAGGLGKRMNSDLPKILHKVNNLPMIVRVINQSLLLNPNNIYIVVGKYKNIIQETINNYIIDTQKIKYILQEQALGTGHCIMCCIDELKKNENEQILILSGDVPLITYNTLKEFINNNSIFSLMVQNKENPYGYGRIVLENNKFDKIVEEKDCNMEEKKINLVNSGIYYMNSRHIINNIDNLTNNNSQKEYYLTDLIKLIKDNENIIPNIYIINKEREHEVMGINNKEELDYVNSNYK